MRNTQYNVKNKKGFVLSLVLWISAAMMLLSLLFVRFSKDENQIYKKLHTKLNIELKVQSLFEKISFYIATGVFRQDKIKNNFDNFPKELLLNNTEYVFTEKNISCRFSLLDHSALFSIKGLKHIQKAQKLINQCTAKHYAFSDLYLDWIDPDDFTRVNGAEKSDYLLDGYSYIPSNYNSFQHHDSICLLKGFCDINRTCIDTVKREFTTYSYRPLNIYLIDTSILKTFFPDKNNNEIDMMLKMKKRNRDEFKKMFSFLSYESYDIYPSKVVEIHITCNGDGTKSVLDTVVDFNVFKNRSWAILEIDKR